VSCFIFGDCLALGLAAVLGGCASDAKVGISSTAVIQKAPTANYDLVVISTGSNDPTNPRLSKNLETIRSKVHAGQVVWVRPVNAIAGRAVVAVALEHGDGAASVKPGRDNVHPRSYRVLAEAVLRAQVKGGMESITNQVTN
jgi:hypothetical protein